MTQEAFDREKQYHTMMCLSTRMLSQGLLTEQELKKVENALYEKYRPTFRRKIT